jgi:hypothetical protein
MRASRWVLLAAAVASVVGAVAGVMPSQGCGYYDACGNGFDSGSPLAWGGIAVGLLLAVVAASLAIGERSREAADAEARRRREWTERHAAR